LYRSPQNRVRLEKKKDLKKRCEVKYEEKAMVGEGKDTYVTRRGVGAPT